jgi:hypothetical protein
LSRFNTVNWEGRNLWCATLEAIETPGPGRAPTPGITQVEKCLECRSFDKRRLSIVDRRKAILEPMPNGIPMRARDVRRFGDCVGLVVSDAARAYPAVGISPRPLHIASRSPLQVLIRSLANEWAAVQGRVGLNSVGNIISPKHLIFVVGGDGLEPPALSV